MSGRRTWPRTAFLRGDGGLAAVVWTTAKARAAAGPGAAGIATEDDVSTLSELAEHVARRRAAELASAEDKAKIGR